MDSSLVDSSLVVSSLAVSSLAVSSLAVSSLVVSSLVVSSLVVSSQVVSSQVVSSQVVSSQVVSSQAVRSQAVRSQVAGQAARNRDGKEKMLERQISSGADRRNAPAVMRQETPPRRARAKPNRPEKHRAMPRGAMSPEASRARRSRGARPIR